MTDGSARDLQAQVKELEATVRGLTEEFVEAKERIRQLEDELDAAGEPADGTEVVRAERSGKQQAAESEPETADADQAADTEAESDQDDDGETTLGDDIIVA
ncbi:hypothetical protein ACFQH6_05560 [Halobacteriaceae archaeon GCM10025711]